MPRLIGVDIPDNKHIHIALRYIYGIGPSISMNVLKEAGVDPNLRARDLSEDELSRLATIIERNYTVEGELRRQNNANISRLREITCYRGLRHRRGLPVRGQRTRTNARTRKGRKKTVAGKKSVKSMR